MVLSDQKQVRFLITGLKLLVSDMESFENMQDLVRDMNKEIKSSTGEVFFTDENGVDKELSYVEDVGGYNIACYIAGQEVPVGYINMGDYVDG